MGQTSPATSWKVRGSKPGTENKFFFPQNVQSGSGAHPATYSMGTGVSFSGGKAAGAWGWPLISIHFGV
jgi:hypothetical protein